MVLPEKENRCSGGPGKDASVTEIAIARRARSKSQVERCTPQFYFLKIIICRKQDGQSLWNFISLLTISSQCDLLPRRVFMVRQMRITEEHVSHNLYEALLEGH